MIDDKVKQGLIEFDKTLAIGTECVVRWLNDDGNQYETTGRITKLNEKSVWLMKLEDVGWFKKDTVIQNIPRITNNKWSIHRTLLPIGYTDSFSRTTIKSASVEANWQKYIHAGPGEHFVPFELRPNAPPPGMTSEQRWTKAAVDMFVGRKIVAARYMSNEEAEALGWPERAVVLQLDDGNLIFPSQDDEGNSAGALFTNDDKEPIFPVLHLKRG